MKELKATISPVQSISGRISSGKTLHAEIEQVRTVSTVGALPLNLAHEDTAPEDTRKLWIKTKKPGNIELHATANWPYWKSSANLPSPMAQSHAVSLGGKLWSCGGYGPYPTESGDWIRNDEIRYFEPGRGHVVTNLRLPQGLCRVAMAAVGEKLYFFGGQGMNRSLTDQILVLDTASMSLTTLETTLPVPSYRYAAAVGDIIYMFGGYDGNTELDEILAFDTRDHSIRTLDTRLPEIAWALGVAECGGKIYIFGGQRGTSPDTGMDRILRFNPADESLTEMKAKLPKVHINPVPVTVGDNIWLLGGYRYTVSGIALYEFFNSVDIYHTREDWLVPSGANLTMPGAYMAAGLIDGIVYSFGGMRSKDQYSAIGESLDVRSSAKPNTIRIQLGGLYDEPKVSLYPESEELCSIRSLTMTTEDGYYDRPRALVYKDGAWVDI